MTQGDHQTRTLRVVFITEDDPLYVIRFFEVFLAEYPRDQIELCGITVARAFSEPIWKTARRLLPVYGLVGFLRLGRRFLQAKVRGRSIGKLASAAGVTVLPTRSVNDPLYVEVVRSHQPDVIVSVAAPEVFRDPLLDSARLGCINLHSGRLPTYRGMLPSFWQMLRGEAHATVTVHEMVRQLDAGLILATDQVPIRQRDSLDRVMRQSKERGARLMIQVLRQLATNQSTPRPADAGEPGYFSFPTRADARAFRQRGHRFL